jgi:hypothetical protein
VLSPDDVRGVDADVTELRSGAPSIEGMLLSILPGGAWLKSVCGRWCDSVAEEVFRARGRNGALMPVENRSTTDVRGRPILAGENTV